MDHNRTLIHLDEDEPLRQDELVLLDTRDPSTFTRCTTAQQIHDALTSSRDGGLR